MRRLPLSLVAGLLFVSAPTALAAQEARGTIQGRVSDASGGTIPGATVTVTSRATGIVTTATSNAEGNYRVPFLNPGSTGSRSDSRASANRSRRTSSSIWPTP